MMDDFGIGYEQNLPISRPNTHAPIEVFAMQEMSFIERPYIRDHLSALSTTLDVRLLEIRLH